MNTPGWQVPNSRKDEEMGPKQQHPIVDVTADRNKVQCYKEQYCIGNWNVRSMSQGKLEVIKLSKSECRHSRSQRTKMEWVNLTQMTIMSATVGRNPLEEMG